MASSKRITRHCKKSGGYGRQRKGTKRQGWRAEGGKVENTEEQEETMHTLPPSVLDATMEGLGTRFTRLCVVARLMTPHAKDKVGLHQTELIEKARWM